jgi:hypothetical protein
MVKIENFPTLPFETFGPELDKLLKDEINKLDHEWPSKYASVPDAHHILRGHLLIAETTYGAIRFLAADLPEEKKRKLEFAISLSPLVRGLLDTLSTIVFIFEDLPSRVSWYIKGGWRELKEELGRYEERYGEIPEWEEWLSESRKFVEYTRSKYGVTKEEASDIKILKYWMIPSWMVKDKNTSEERREFIRYMIDWFYRELSADSHLSLTGLMRRAAPLISKDENVLRKLKSDSVGTAIIILVAILSELQIELDWDLSPRLKYVWGILNPYMGIAQELYDFRYRDRL